MKLAAATTALKRLPITGESGTVLLELDLAKGMSESPPATPIEALRSMHTPMLRTVVEHLRRAEKDDKVAGLIAHVGNTGLTLAQSEELRAAVARLRHAGKVTVAHAETFGEMAPDNVGYHLACAFEQIWLQPSGAVGLFGFSGQGLYLREALDKLQIVPQLGQRHEYKSAAELLMRADMSEPAREMMGRLVDSAMEVLVDDVAAARGLSADAVRAAAAQSPIGAQQALEANLIDRIGYRDEAYAAVRERATDAQLKYVERYRSGRFEMLTSTLTSMPTNKPTIGVVQASGPVVLGHGGGSPMAGRYVASDRVCAALRAAGQAKHVAAVVLRIDSPGGSYVASDAIRREVIALQDKGIPVVASMASVAASGGYFIAMPARRIVANQSTITGSIGVLGGKAVLAQALGRIGVKTATVRSSEHADMFGTHRPFDEDELAMLDQWLDTVYEDFTTKAAHDRGMGLQDLQAVARGRVWTGADALERGLVDQTGGLAVAVDQACTLAGVRREKADVRPIPKPNPFEQLMPAENSESAAVAAPWRVPGPESTLAWLANAVGLRIPGVLSLPVMQLPGLLPVR